VTVGTCTLTANQAGNANYNAAPEVTATVNITQGTQTMSVFYPNSSLAAGATVQLTATGGGSPNLVTFTSGSTSICTVSASTAGANSTSVANLSVLAAGDCLLTANQAGDALYLAAAPVSLTLTIGAGSQIFYVHTDHLGTPRTITQASGNGKVWEWKNDDPFGANMPDENPSGIAGTFKYNLRFPGQYYDQETGTYYNYFRDYDPSVGRYIQSDPIGLDGGINTYGYVKASPLMHVDPDGLNPLAIGVGIGVRVIGGRAALVAIGATARRYGPAGMAAACLLAGVCTFQDKTPNEGEPGSCHINPGSGQERKYGPDGKPEYDIDWDHDHGKGAPHGHNWERGPDGQPTRGPGVEISPWPRGRGRGGQK
jgi:RHS repeat-associated protein